MAAEIKAEFGVDAELIKDGGGVFDVVVQDNLVFSKHAQDNRFPTEGEVVKIMKALDS